MHIPVCSSFPARVEGFFIHGLSGVHLLLLLLLLLQGCVRESAEECVEYNLTVKAVDSEGKDITSTGVISVVDIYLFDANGFVRKLPRGSSANFVFGTKKGNMLTLVAWGNLNGDSLELPELTVGTSLEDARLSLLQSVSGYNLPLSDLFYGRRRLNGVSTRGMQNDTARLVMERWIAGLSLTVKHASEYLGSGEFNFHAVVRGTGGSLNFLGEPLDNEVSYALSMRRTAGKDEWETGLFRIFPTGEGRTLCIDLYKDNALLFTITTDDEGHALHALIGKETYITVDFRQARLHVSVSVKPWSNDGEQNTQL